MFLVRTYAPMSTGVHPAEVSAEGSTKPLQPNHEGRLKVLDGWRAVSILMVMAGHLLPLGPQNFNFNEPVAAGGMAIFFTLSGFLITRFLLDRPEVFPFLVRRLLRILPLAWLVMIILFFADGATNSTAPLLANLAFYANLPPAKLLYGGGHLWSLCVEMHFYLGVALLVAIAGRRGLLLLPVIAVLVTGARIAAGETISIVTWHRVDEILAGAIVALMYSNSFGKFPARILSQCNFYVAVVLAAVCTYYIGGPLGYARPYAVAFMVGITLWHAPSWARSLLESRPALYIAKISYALYVFHGVFTHTWLSTGDTVIKYAKRPLLFAVTWAAAHSSTFYYEQRFIDLAKRLTTRRLPVGPHFEAGRAR